MIYNPFTLRVNATLHDDILLLLQPQFFMQMAFLSFKPQISTCVLSSLFSICFLLYFLRELAQTSRHFLIISADHSVHSPDLYL